MKKVIAIACDIECTSWDIHGGDLISSAMVEILEDYALGRSEIFYSRPRGSKYFTDKAAEIHGISYWQAQTFPDAKDSCLNMMEWLSPLLPKFPLKMIQHAAGNFDFRWMESHFKKEDFQSSFWKAFKKEDTESTLYMAKRQLVHLKDHKLPTICEHYSIELDHHNALSDAKACAKIWCNLKQDKDTWTGKLL